MMADQYLTDGAVFPVSQSCSVLADTGRKASSVVLPQYLLNSGFLDVLKGARIVRYRFFNLSLT